MEKIVDRKPVRVVNTADGITDPHDRRAGFLRQFGRSRTDVSEALNDDLRPA